MSLTRQFVASAAQVGRVRREVRAHASQHGVVDCEAVALAVSEAVTNALLHARPRGASLPCVELTAELRTGPVFVVTVADDGLGLRPRTDSPGAGLGLVLIEGLTDELDIASGAQGTRVTMGFRVGAGVVAPARAG